VGGFFCRGRGVLRRPKGVRRLRWDAPAREWVAMLGQEPRTCTEEEMGHGGERLGRLGTLGFIFSFSISFSFLYLKPDFVFKFKFNHALRV
jgi:hypothetical protein